MSRPIKPVTTVPEWLRIAAPNAMLNAKDFAELLGTSVKALHQRVRNGHVPPHEMEIHRKGSAHPTYQWHVSTVRKFIASSLTR